MLRPDTLRALSNPGHYHCQPWKCSKSPPSRKSTGVTCSSEVSLPFFILKYSGYSSIVSGVQRALFPFIFHSTTPQRHFCGLASKSKHISKREGAYGSQQPAQLPTNQLPFSLPEQQQPLYTGSHETMLRNTPKASGYHFLIRVKRILKDGN